MRSEGYGTWVCVSVCLLSHISPAYGEFDERYDMMIVQGMLGEREVEWKLYSGIYVEDQFKTSSPF